MKAEREVADRHPAGYRWAQKLEEETGIHNLVGLHWDVFPAEGRAPLHAGCDTAWMLAHICPATWRSARKLVLSAIAGLPHRADAKLVSPVTDREREKARVAIAKVEGGAE